MKTECLYNMFYSIKNTLFYLLISQWKKRQLYVFDSKKIIEKAGFIPSTFCIGFVWE